MSAVFNVFDQTVNKIRLWSSRKLFKIIGIGLLLFGVRQLYNILYRKIRKYPPGPIGLPFVGSLFSCLDIAKYASYLSSNYGGITMIYIGQQPFIFLHSIEYINEILKNPNTLDREFDNSLLLKHLKSYEINTAASSEKYWIRKRKIFQSVILSHLDTSVINDVHNKSLSLHVFQSINQCIKENKLWHPTNDLNYISFYFIWHSLFGLDLNEETLNNSATTAIFNLISDCFQEGAIDFLLRNLRIHKIFPSRLLKYLSLKSSLRKLERYIEEEIYKQLNYDEDVFDMNDKKWIKHFQDVLNNKNKCIVSKLIAYHRNEPGIDSTKNSIISEIVLFFMAGLDTTIHSTEYGLILLAKYPKDQEKIYNELKEVFGDDSLMNKTRLNQVIVKLHYFRAFIYELFRLSSVAAIGNGHYNSKSEIWLKNKKYCIPKQSVIFYDVPSGNKKDLYWHKKTNGKPNSLCLNAWLDSNKKFNINLNKDKMVTFGVGKRNCAGKAMAEKSLYLLFVKFILNYQFRLNEKNKNITIKQKFKFTMLIHPKIGLMVTNRHSV